LRFSPGATAVVCPATTVNRYVTSSAKFVVPMAVGSPSAAFTWISWLLLGERGSNKTQKPSDTALAV